MKRRRRCLYTSILKDWRLKDSGKVEARRELESQSLQFKNILANELTRNFSDLTMNECLESGNRVLHVKQILGELEIFNSPVYICDDKETEVIYRYFFIIWRVAFMFCHNIEHWVPLHSKNWHLKNFFFFFL